MTILAAPDVEAVAVAYLNEALTARGDAARASTAIPATRPARLVRVQRLGGGRRNRVTDEAVLTVQCWDTRTTNAFGLARLVEALVFDLEGADRNGVWVRAVTSVGGISYFPDPDSDSPRYQFTVELNCRLQIA